jgi:hypothetical protein
LPLPTGPPSTCRLDTGSTTTDPVDRVGAPDASVDVDWVGTDPVEPDTDTGVVGTEPVDTDSDTGIVGAEPADIDSVATESVEIC